MTARFGRIGIGRASALALGAYVLGRLISLELLRFAVRHLRGHPPLVGGRFVLWHKLFERWDARHYESIAVNGYPVPLPTAADGTVLQNDWAFFPVFPMTAGAFSRVTGLPFDFAAIIINLIAGAVAAVLLSKLVRSFADEGAALRAVLLWACFPTAFVLQVPYAEALYLALSVSCLLAITQRRDALAAALLITIGFTRGYILPLSAAAFVRLGLDLVPAARRFDLPGLKSERQSSSMARVALAVAAIIAPVAWLAIAAYATGRPDAYTATQQAWNFTPGLEASVGRWQEALGEHGWRALLSVPVGTVAATVVVTVILCASRVPLLLKVYGVTAGAMLVGLAQPGAVAFTSTPRFAFSILTLPIALALVVQRTWLLALVLAAFASLQYLWILNIWSGRIAIAP